MGVGKTPTTLAAIESFRDEGHITHPVLVVVLNSLKTQWRSEIQKFTDRKSIIVQGEGKTRAEQYQRARRFSYVIVHYDLINTDWEHLRRMTFSAIIADEASALRRFRSLRTRRLKELASTTMYRFGLTATPIENGQADELFSIMEFVDSRVLGRFEDFEEKHVLRHSFGGIAGYKNLPALHKKLAEAVVRRKQTDPAVKKFLPKTNYRDPIYVPFDRPTKTLYRRIASDLIPVLTRLREEGVSGYSLADIYGEEEEKKRWSPLDQLKGDAARKAMVLRQVCVSTDVIRESALRHLTDAGGNTYAGELMNDGALDKPARNPKVDAVVSYAQEHLDIDPSYKLIIFVTWVDAVREFGKRFEELGIPAAVYHGQLTDRQRELAKVAFQEDPDVRVFVSSDAGGYGVNLQQANLLINADLPWTAGAHAQRNGRIQRASSEWSHITIQDFVMEDSIEERHRDLVMGKARSAHMLIDATDEVIEETYRTGGESLLSFLTQRS
jgi:SNF2 family DNA or RNA helicase